MAGAVPLERVISAVAKRTGKKFIVDPRVRADVTVVGQEATSIDYPTLLSSCRCTASLPWSRRVTCE